jgi:uncharacterized cupredoxin-like copper-binding protein
MQASGRRLLMVTVLAFSVVACSSNGGGGSSTSSAGAKESEQESTVAVDLKEFSITPRTPSAPAGELTFNAKNVGKTLHELVVIKTDKAPGDLPVTNGEADETGDLGEAEDIDPGTTKSVTLVLQPGKYVLICNVPGHYQSGMHTGFTVT